MKLKPVHIIVAVLVFIGGFLVLAFTRTGNETGPGEARPPSRAATTGEVAGSVPPIDADPDFVPVIELATTDLDVGVVPNDRRSLHALEVTNRGKAPLRIHNIQTNCACTQGHIAPEKSTIAPGETGVIDVVIDPYRIPGFSSSRVLTISSNDPVTTTVMVDVHAEVEPELDLSADEVRFGEVMLGDTPTETLHIRQIFEGDWSVSLVDLQSLGGAPLEGITATFTEVTGDDGVRAYDIEVAITDEARRGTIEGGLFIFSNLPRIPQLRLPVHAEIVSPVTADPAFPQRLVLQTDDDGLRSGTARLTARTGTITLGALRYDEAVLAVSADTEGPAEEIRLSVQAADGATDSIDENIVAVLETVSGTVEERIAVRARSTAE